FTGKERDAESGLDYFGARLYMPAFARWTSVDPLAEKHPEWSPYNYVLNNPLALIDPDGRQVSAQNSMQVFADLDRRLTPLKQVVERGAELAGMKSFVQGTGEVASGNLVRGAILIATSAPLPSSRGAGVVRAAGEALDVAGAAGRAVTKLGNDAAQVGVQANRAKGKLAEALVKDQLKGEGVTVLGSQVSVRTSAGRRVLDHLTELVGGKLRAVEVKSGNAKRNVAQREKDRLMAKEGGIIIGKNAPEGLRGQPRQISTTERRP
ncbi:MAG: RHS repeat-associated core domain-containing protein, partial [Gemmatimonadaceae bacterium]|nr:RHS repeat-associated core domain-containing protein [Gemmatimonadaceae bacterium]